MTVLPDRTHRRPGTARAVLAVGASVKVPIPRQEASMADKAAGPQRSGDKASPGKKPGSRDRAAAAGQPKSRDSASQRDKPAPADEVQPKFREALERKRAREASTAGMPPGKDARKIHGAHGPAGKRRSFRRKSG
jgi:hypothetical protein